MTNYDTMQDAGYRYKRPLGHGQHVLERIADGKLEIWACNKNHASYGIKWRNTHLEFCRSWGDPHIVMATLK